MRSKASRPPTPIRVAHPRIGVVVLSQHADEAYALELRRDGAGGGPTRSRIASATSTSCCALLSPRELDVLRRVAAVLTPLREGEAG